MLAFLGSHAAAVAAGPDPSPLPEQSGAEELCAGAARDFGGVALALPAAVLRPSTAEDVSSAVTLTARSDSLTVSARGNGHSVAGQAMAENGLVLDMRSLGPGMELVRGDGLEEVYADVPAGVLWEELLLWAVRNFGLSPVSWTDYLRLTVGGTLSNGGVSGQSFRHGPQVSNVARMEVVTGDGEVRVCSQDNYPDLFFAVLGGLGQFGIITRARIPLAPAPRMVRWVRALYTEFSDYARDAESLVTVPSFDYLEGFAFVNNDDPVNGRPSVPLPPGRQFDVGKTLADAGPMLYCLEVALYYNHRQDDEVDERVAAALRPLKFVRGLEFAVDVAYVEFLLRVNRAEEEARSNGTWASPHPWLNIFISAADIADFDRTVLKRTLRDGVGGPMLVYPMLRSKWDSRTSVALPSSPVFYLVALLRFPRPHPEGPPASALLAENAAIVEHCRSAGYDFKLYLPHYETDGDWARHFGTEGWPEFLRRKARYDPLAVLAPGQKIFTRVRATTL